MNKVSPKNIAPKPEFTLKFVSFAIKNETFIFQKSVSPWLRRFYVPSGMPSYHKLFPQGSSPLIDHLLSTESTEFVHHGASVSRYDKTAVLKAWPAPYHKLRVCADKLHMHGFENCSICHKCCETMVILELLAATTNYNNFSSKKLTPIDYLRWGVFTHLNP